MISVGYGLVFSFTDDKPASDQVITRFERERAADREYAGYRAFVSHTVGVERQCALSCGSAIARYPENT